MSLQVGQTIEASFLSARAKVVSFVARKRYYLLDVVLNGTNQYSQHKIFPDELASIEVINEDEFERIGRGEDLFFFIEAHRIRLAYQFDPQLAVSISQVDPLPHQIEAVYHYILPSPRIRFLIADDPGAGKTIMAGLLLKELQYRRLVRRVLIVAPGHLKYQWQREMKERFGTTFAIVDRARIESAWGENVWEERDYLITSIDFVKQDAVRTTLSSTRWDLVIVDEAHKMSAYAYEGRQSTKIKKTKRYQVGELLSRYTTHMLFLTATPHRGNEENFRLFLDLLRPGFFAQTDLLRQSVEDGDNPIFIRRLKEDMRRFDGKPIFPPRHVHTVAFGLSAQEIDLYNKVTRYVQEYFDKAKENRSISFALMMLQRRLTSSAYAILSSLEKRRKRLEQLLLLPEKIRQDEDYLRVQRLTDEDLEELSDQELAEIEERLAHLTIAKNIAEVRVEIQQLEPLIEQARRVREMEIESKLKGLQEKVLTTLGERKLLIFTEFRDTLNYLTMKFTAWGYEVVTIHGQMNMNARIAAEHRFRDGCQIMVATEAAGEGINLQFCSLMINYDIPWNPNRLEQRMGRIHRYGQNQEVHIWNMIAQDTREGQILQRLFEKLEKMKLALGSDRVFDIIGEMIPGARLDELIKDAIFNQRRMEEIEHQIDQMSVKEAEKSLERAFLTSLATRHIDYTGLRQDNLTADENRLVPEYVEDFFVRAFRRLGGTIMRRDKAYRVPTVPYALRRWGEDYTFKSAYGQLFHDYRRVTFDKHYARQHPETAFVAPGHPLLEALNEEILSKLADKGTQYALFGDPNGQQEGLLWFVEGEINDGTGKSAAKRVFCLYHTTDGTISQISPAVLWDYEPLDDTPLPAFLEALLGEQEEMEDVVVQDVLRPFRNEILARRTRSAQIKEKYGLRSLDFLIAESNNKILDYQVRQQLGEAVELPLLNETRHLEQLEARREELLTEIRLEGSLTIGEMRLLGVAIVIPHPMRKDKQGKERQINESAQEYMQRNDESEAVGMREAMRHEEERGWQPEDVSHKNLGFDIRSLCYNEDGIFTTARYIEVKARQKSGAIRLTANEWKMARRYQDDYWLYIVTQAASVSPQLSTIQNPALNFREGEDIFATGFIVPEAKWRERIRGA